MLPSNRVNHKALIDLLFSIKKPSLSIKNIATLFRLRYYNNRKILFLQETVCNQSDTYRIIVYITVYLLAP